MITLNDMIARFGKDELAEVTDEQHHEVIDETKVNLAISDAVGVACGYLNAVGLVRRNSSGGFDYVGAVIPSDLIMNICNIARYNLHKDGGTETIKDRRHDAVKWLKEVKKDPEMLTGAVINNSVSGAVVIPNPEPKYWSDD